MELCLETGDEPAEILWVMITGRPVWMMLQWVSATDCSIWKKKRPFSDNWDFNQPDICWKSNTEDHKQSRRFLERIGGNFFVYAMEQPAKGGALLELIIRIYEQELVGELKVGANLAVETMI